MLTTAHGGRDTLRFRDDVAEPVLGDTDLLLAVGATSVNFHDIFTRRGMPGVRIALPVIAGSDISGTVLAVGPAADPSWLGKRVLVDPVLRDPGRFGMLGETLPGGRAERVAVGQSMVIEIPASVTFEQAAALPLAYGTAYRMLFARGALRAGERMLVLGASGGVGIACVQLGKMAGAEVVACASGASKLAKLREIGADHVVDYRERPISEAVKELYGKPRVTGSGGVDVAINFTGGDTLVPTQKCVKLGGRILSCGATAGFDLPLDARYWWTFEQTLIGSNGWSKDDLSALLELVAHGRLPPVIDRVLSIEEAAEGERLLEDREVVGKVVLTP